MRWSLGRFSTYIVYSRELFTTFVCFLAFAQSGLKHQYIKKILKFLILNLCVWFFSWLSHLLGDTVETLGSFRLQKRSALYGVIYKSKRSVINTRLATARNRTPTAVPPSYNNHIVKKIAVSLLIMYAFCSCCSFNYRKVWAHTSGRTGLVQCYLRKSSYFKFWYSYLPHPPPAIIQKGLCRCLESIKFKSELTPK